MLKQIMVNACTGKMGKAFIEKAETAGLHVVPVSFGSEEKSGKSYQVCGKEFLVQGPSSDRENILRAIHNKYPEFIVVDFTVASAVNDNAELYCKVGVPFVMGTNGGDRDLLFRTAHVSNVYALISPQMGKQIAAFHGAMEVLADLFRGAFKDYSLSVLVSHQGSEASASVNAIVPCFTRMGVDFNDDQAEWGSHDEQKDILGVPEQHLHDHSSHLFHWFSPDETEEFQLQLDTYGRSMYTEGTVAAVHFLARKIKSKHDEKVYNFFDVMLEREGCDEL
ncbi:4-hydroxy-tetrahydrodipicolinate reductase 2, chloroplastic-like isoform X2 [Prosopis cineraria]|uniref:4-hydroxy-tetrahydrodipicolinate reductase 2, chloroplastic-like isoform X2 n=1 Tax=Prosopis cineraria TaxID=364024 RepID=UPI00240F011E|nr:4-hydroxy-tetrahydrodipicolinate reductase 2, chloroplastic-like isoform X2 [Prosopis cineraria]